MAPNAFEGSDTIHHRDFVITGTGRLHRRCTGPVCFEPAVGVSLVIERTTADPPERIADDSRNTPAFAAGFDVPVRVAPDWLLVPTFRYRRIARTPLPSSTDHNFRKYQGTSLVFGVDVRRDVGRRHVQP